MFGKESKGHNSETKKDGAIILEHNVLTQYIFLLNCMKISLTYGMYENVWKKIIEGA